MRAGEAAAKKSSCATLELCLVRAGDGWYGIDTREIREVLDEAHPQRVPLAPPYIAGVLAYRGEALTAVSLRALLGLPPATGRCRVLVLDDREFGETLGLIVDAVKGVATVATDAIEANPATLEPRSCALLSGVLKTDTGLVARLDAQRLRPSELALSGLFEREGRLA